MLGDGYGENVRFGLNLIKPNWSIQWMVSRADASTIDLFLRDRAADGEWFYWTPPDSSSILCWRCDEWTIDHEAASLVKVEATFRQVFELIVPTLTPVDGTCISDCTDVAVDSAWDVWVTRLIPSDFSYQYASNVYVADNGYIYMAFLYPVEGVPQIHVAKFQPGGQVVWVNRYTNAQISATNVGNAPQLRITEIVGQYAIAVMWEATVYRTSFGSGLWGSFSGEMNGLLCIGTGNGSVKWGNKFFSNSGEWQTYSGPCSHHTGAFVPNGATSFLSYNKYSKLLLAQVHYRKIMAFSVDGDYPSVQIGHESPYINDQGFPIVDVGYLGGQRHDYIVAGNSSYVSFIFAPSLGGSAISQSGFRAYSTAPNSIGGATPSLAGFLGNGQAIIYYTGIGTGGKDEIIIIGANGIIIDQVRLPSLGYLRSFGTSAGRWPYEPNSDGTASNNWSLFHSYAQVKLVESDSAIYVNCTTTGLNVLAIDVTLSAGRVTRINGLKGTGFLNTNPTNNKPNLGATRYSCSSSKSTRMVATSGKARYGVAEVCLVGMKRTLNTNDATLTLNIGSRNSSALGTYVEFVGNRTTVSGVTRTDLLGRVESINDVWTSVSSIPLNQPCPPGGADIISFDIPSQATDVTSSMPFNLYTAYQS